MTETYYRPDCRRCGRLTNALQEFEKRYPDEYQHFCLLLGLEVIRDKLESIP